MPYFLDGNNLIGRARGTGRPSEEDRKAFLAEIADRLRATKAKATVFFDGGDARRFSLGPLTVRDCGGQSADDVIVAEIGRFREPREVLVVTADRGLSGRVQDAGGRAIEPGEFWSRFGKGGRTPSRNDPAKVDVEEWMRFFEDESNRSS